MSETIQLRTCGDCGVNPGFPHKPGCDVERCSVCGEQWMVCGHKRHDPFFARWTGIWPGFAEATILGLDLNEFGYHYYEIFFIKPTKRPSKIRRLTAEVLLADAERIREEEKLSSERKSKTKASSTRAVKDNEEDRQ